MMKIKLLNKGYKKSEKFYNDFLRDRIISNDQYFSGKSAEIQEAPDFPIYMARGSEKEKETNFKTALRVISQSYIDNDREIHMSETFWHSLLVTKKRDYILRNYSEVKESKKKFNMIVTRDFNWENYIYKCVLAAEYIKDQIGDPNERDHFFDLVVENMDLYNYIIKSTVFRNAEFLVKILKAIDELDCSDIMKAEIVGRPDLGKDERYGRRVIFELNKKYPVIMSPLLSVEDLKVEINKALNLYI